MYCNHCGAKNADAAQFCQKCGKPTAPVEPPTEKRVDETRPFKLSRPKKPSWSGVLGVLVTLAAIAAGRFLGQAFGDYWLLLAALGVTSVIGAYVGAWYAKRPAHSRKVTAVVSWANVITWLIPFVGTATGFAAYQFGKAEARRAYKVVGTVGVSLAVINALVAAYWTVPNFVQPDEPTVTETEDHATQDASSAVLAADYDEGHKAGYADGRSQTGQLGDNYLPPATEERNAEYTRGYVDGYALGCREGGFDCTEQLAELNGDVPVAQ